MRDWEIKQKALGDLQDTLRVDKDARELALTQMLADDDFEARKVLFHRIWTLNNKIEFAGSLIHEARQAVEHAYAAEVDRVRAA